MKQPQTQQEAIRSAFAAGLTLSPVNAFKETGTMKIATRVGELVREGWVIKKQWTDGGTRFGGKCRFMAYTLDKEKTPPELYKPFELKKFKHFYPINGQQYLML